MCRTLKNNANCKYLSFVDCTAAILESLNSEFNHAMLFLKVGFETDKKKDPCLESSESKSVASCLESDRNCTESLEGSWADRIAV